MLLLGCPFFQLMKSCCCSVACYTSRSFIKRYKSGRYWEHPSLPKLEHCTPLNMQLVIQQIILVAQIDCQTLKWKNVNTHPIFRFSHSRPETDLHGKQATVVARTCLKCGHRFRDRKALLNDLHERGPLQEGR